MKPSDKAKTTSASSGTTSKTSASLSHVSKLLLDVDALQVAFSGEPAIDQVTFCLHSGEFVGLIGPNGAGKTTLLKAVLGLQKPTGGTVKRQRGTTIGYVPQRGALYNAIVPISTLEVVRLGAPDGATDQALAALARVGMEAFATRTFSELSGGQQQRVSIAKALAGQASLLILDEPTAGIDERSQDTFYKLLRSLQDDGVTIVMVSHEVDTVLSLVTRVICLNQTIIYDGPPEHFETDKYLPLIHTQQHIQLHHHHETGSRHA